MKVWYFVLVLLIGFLVLWGLFDGLANGAQFAPCIGGIIVGLFILTLIFRNISVRRKAANDTKTYEVLRAQREQKIRNIIDKY